MLSRERSGKENVRGGSGKGRVSTVREKIMGVYDKTCFMHVGKWVMRPIILYNTC